MSVHHFCTLFDSNYLLQGVAMLHSLKQHCPAAHVHVLCMDVATQRILSAFNFTDVTCISLPDLEDDALLAVKQGRSVAEYCWTLSPSLPWYVLQKNPQIDFITYVDADLYFYSPLQPLFDEIGPASVAITEHRFSPKLRYLEENGRFCVQWISFRRDEEGMACLLRWRDQCLEWCYNRLEEGRFGDQKYLDEWPERYKNLHILRHTGAGVAPWNYAQFAFREGKQNALTVDEVPLIFYHFHSFRLMQSGEFYRLVAFYAEERTEPELVYRRYERATLATLRAVRLVAPDFLSGVRPLPLWAMRGKRWLRRHVPLGVKEVLRRFAPR